eukprot:2832264-Karenia_brevis.AAC.1
MQDGVCRLFTPSTVSMFSGTKVRELVVEAEQLMSDVRLLMTKMQVDQAKITRAVGMLHIRCIAFISKKGKELEGKHFDSIAAIAQALNQKWKC